MAGIACGVIGLPNVGKSTLFNALTRAGARVENYPFCTIDPNVAVVTVPDDRLDLLNEVEQKPDKIPAAIEFIDIAGLVEGASRGEGRGNQFLENIHHADLLLHVVRAFRGPNVAHVTSELSPEDDIRTVNLELILADLKTAAGALERLGKKSRGGDDEAKRAVEIVAKVRDVLDDELPASRVGLTKREQQEIRDLRFLTMKPCMYVANVHEEDLPEMENSLVGRIREFVEPVESAVLPVCAKIESEIGELESEAEILEFSREMGLPEGVLGRLIRECYQRLGLSTFFTVGDSEVRAWTIPRGATAPEAGAVVHTDFQEKFIRAEVISFEDFRRCGTRANARHEGLMRIEGRDYTVKDGDILFFRVQK